MGYMYISIHAHVASIVLDTCTFGDMYIDISLTCALTFHLHVQEHVHVHVLVSNYCIDLWGLSITYEWTMSKEKTIIFKGFNDLTTCTLIGYITRNYDFGWSLQVNSKFLLM